MFRAAFLRKVPLFVRNFAENVLLCAVAAGVESTSRRFLERLKLFWRAKLTDRIHRQYFSSMVHPWRGCTVSAMCARLRAPWPCPQAVHLQPCTSQAACGGRRNVRRGSYKLWTA